MFHSTEWSNLMNVALKHAPNKRNIIAKMNCSARTLLRWAENKSGENKEVLKALLPKLAAEGKVDVQLDHKFTGADKESRSKVLGVDLRYFFIILILSFL